MDVVDIPNVKVIARAAGVRVDETGRVIRLYPRNNLRHVVKNADAVTLRMKKEKRIGLKAKIDDKT